ncbi:unnamed protein product [Hymenolepis diminuta]|uniref:Uncharacterized protein n=1 Tax=Hymenolepis diminuta TaxID=6216 RepID=A0A564YTN3_HYMDI|nr:unnamed protein product [Hymenolepis diminuta]
MSKHVHRFPLFSITASLHIKGTSALMLWHGLTQTTHACQYRLLHVLFISSLPQHAALSISLPLLTRLKLVVASLNTFLVYSTLGVLLHNCCYLFLKQPRIGDCYGCRNLLAANYGSNKFFHNLCNMG